MSLFRKNFEKFFTYNENPKIYEKIILNAHCVPFIKSNSKNLTPHFERNV